jgi:hypothetical protein
MRLLLSLLCLGGGGCGLSYDPGETTVPQNEVARIELLVPERRLPRTARNVHLRYVRFQDDLMHVRFDADAAEARTFAREMLGRPLGRSASASISHSLDLDWWITAEQLRLAEVGEDTLANGDGLPRSKIALIAAGDTARVWLITFAD